MHSYGTQYEDPVDFEEGEEFLIEGPDCTQNPDTGNCFTLLEFGALFEQAVEKCKERGGFLPFSLDARDFSTLSQFKKDNYGFWVGLKKIEEKSECVGSFEVK